MLNGLWGLLERFRQLFVWWAIIQPWESGIRVRLGRQLKKLEPGIHLRVPVIDTIWKQSVRYRVSTLQVQTLTTLDGKVLSVCGAVGYAIGDVLKLYQTLHHAEDTIRSVAMGVIAEFVQNHYAAECKSADVSEAAVALRVQLGQYGLEGVTINIVDFAYLRAYRLITDMKWGQNGDALNTTQAFGDHA